MPRRVGRQVIEARHGAGAEPLPETAYVLASGTNRFGAIGFQERPGAYRPRRTGAPLDDLHEAARTLMDGADGRGVPGEDLLAATPIGGARPKVLICDPDGGQWLARLPTHYDGPFPAVQAEASAYHLARCAGIEVPDTRLVRSLDRCVLLVRRFEWAAGTRRHVLSALTLAESGRVGRPHAA